MRETLLLKLREVRVLRGQPMRAFKEIGYRLKTRKRFWRVNGCMKTYKY
jgi:hypothetical protein